MFLRPFKFDKNRDILHTDLDGFPSSECLDELSTITSSLDGRNLYINILGKWDCWLYHRLALELSRDIFYRVSHHSTICHFMCITLLILNQGTIFCPRAENQHLASRLIVHGHQIWQRSFVKNLTEINDLETISLIFSTAHVIIFRILSFRYSVYVSFPFN